MKRGNSGVNMAIRLLLRGNYYLYAYDGKKFRFYRVDRMENISKPLLEQREGHNLFKEKDLTQRQAKVFNTL